MTAVLKANALTMQFGGLKAVAEFTLEVNPGAIFGLIGPNGAGKTTVFNMLTGVYEPTSGTVEAYGVNVTGKAPYDITKCGMARTFQNIRLFKDLSALDNLMIAMDNDPNREHSSVVASILKTGKSTACEAAQKKRGEELLEIFNLKTRAQETARNLPYGDQRKLEIARAMATGAKLLLLDEPAAGMNAAETAGAHANHSPHPRSLRYDDFTDRARHEVSHGHLRAHRGARVRRQDRGRDAFRYPEKSASHRSVSWKGSRP